MQMKTRQTTKKQKLAQTIKRKKLPLLIFAIVYGLFFINYIDIITKGSSQNGYHLWLVLMYFMPFALLSVIDIKNWKLTIGLGLLTSLMNDVFYGSISYLMGTNINLPNYYNLWLIPQTTQLFTLNLGFTSIAVQSWMMAASIYIRIAFVFLLLDCHKHIHNNWTIPTYISLRRQKVKVGALKPLRHYEPEIFVIPPDLIELEDELEDPRLKMEGVAS